MNKHTPGPWMVLPSVVESQFVVLTEHGVRQDIALTYGFESTPREANARLIASAPDLLEALILMCRSRGSSNPIPAPEHYEAAYAAIAKATQ